MKSLDIQEFVETQCASDTLTLQDYEAELPRWCKGCGDHGLLAAVQRLLRDERVDPEAVVCVSGIGCSSRFPHYMNTYGFHGIHGRALPVALGVTLARPDLHVMAVMGDGDCFSIGAGHWLHTLRYNPNLLVLVLDNEIYALTKNQVSPTTRQGTVTNTTPRGAHLRNLNPLSLMMGISNISFLAQTATWLPVHMEDTLRKAWKHEGLRFIRILQRCPVFVPVGAGDAGQHFPAVFLKNKEGVPVNKGVLKKALVQAHDHRDISAAQRIALEEDPTPLGLVYQNEDVPTYEESLRLPMKEVDRPTLIERLNEELDEYAVQKSF
jgi:2-oxoglutarate ferredoxin oxidoreductase subunit beta